MKSSRSGWRRRDAGRFDAALAASLEYVVAVLGVKAVLVLGHGIYDLASGKVTFG